MPPSSPRGPISLIIFDHEAGIGYRDSGDTTSCRGETRDQPGRVSATQDVIHRLATGEIVPDTQAMVIARVLEPAGVSMIPRPAGMFDRNAEWNDLAGFVADDSPGASLGVVYGRRRQGKTYLLRAMCRETGGFYFGATQTTDAVSLRTLSNAVERYSGVPTRFHDWSEAVDGLLRLGEEKAVPVVIDEFPYLAHANPALPSIIQNALGPLRPERDQSRARILLCGSSMSFMSGILSGSAPLRGRARLDMIIRAFDYRIAREFWSLEEPELAVRVNAVVGGTPAYRDFVANVSPRDLDDFDGWVADNVLRSSGALFREARYLLAGELEIDDVSLYQAVLAAIAEGRRTRGAIANYLERKSSELSHALTVLEDTGFIEASSDAFRANRTVFHIAEPFISFYQTVMVPIWPALEQNDDRAHLWEISRRRFESVVLGPHFERICRRWTHFHAPHELVGGRPYWVGSGTVSDQAEKTVHEVDVVARSYSATGSAPILLLGEVKWGEVMGMRHLNRLDRVRSLLSARGDQDVTRARLACFSAAGFTDELRAEATRTDDILLITLNDLYAR